MGGGPVSGKLRFLEQYLRSRAAERAALSVAEMQQVAGVIEALVATVEGMEMAAVPGHQLHPAKWRVIEGGKQ